jgi:hypothetical protein
MVEDQATSHSKEAARGLIEVLGDLENNGKLDEVAQYQKLDIKEVIKKLENLPA